MPRKLILLSLLFIGTSLVIGGCASGPKGRGGPGGSGGPPQGMRGANMPEGYVARPVTLLFATMDTNSDGLVTLAEVRLGAMKEWNRFDTPKVSPLVLSDWALKTLGASDARPNRLSFDTNLDGQVEKEEFLRGFTREFQDLDKDGDQKLTRAEMVFRLPEMRMMQGPGGGGGSRGGPPSGGGDRPPPR